MAFYGVVEGFDRKRISGWARFEDQGGTAPLQFRLVFRDRPPIEVTRTLPREVGVGFIFDLPEEFHGKEWSEFVSLYDGVLAIADVGKSIRQWRVPMFKSVLLSKDLVPRPDVAPPVAAAPAVATSASATAVAAAPVLAAGAPPSAPAAPTPAAVVNRTTLSAGRLREYSVAPKSDGRLAAFTIAYNEALVIPLWARYYAEVVGPENLYILDHASTVDYTTMVPKGVTVIRLPRDAFDNWLIARTVAMYQRFLLESYDSVLYTDSDEFVCADPELSAGRSLRQVLLDLPEPIATTTGFNLWHDLDNEPAYDPARPVLDQRRLIARETSMDKPLVARVPLSWVPGFHSAVEGGTQVRGLYMLHLRMFDLDHALTKGGHYRASKWNPYDVTHRLASYQRMGEAEIVNWFRTVNKEFRQTSITVFDPAARRTIVPDWMRKAITI